MSKERKQARECGGNKTAVLSVAAKQESHEGTGAVGIQTSSQGISIPQLLETVA